MGPGREENPARLRDGSRGKPVGPSAKIAREAGADVYLSGVAGREYLDRSPFEAAGIEVAFQEFRHSEYD
ncbi:MAG TPA: hypothetical protein DDZ83_01845 [Nitrospinae bacterium]|nr:hypothetical protein [Nitrospinota bacterium]